MEPDLTVRHTSNMGSAPYPEGLNLDGLVRYWTPGAEAGDSDAMVGLCAAYIARQDWDAAEPWAQRLADNGSVFGMRFLGHIQEHRGDEAGAREWNRRAEEAHSRTPEGRSAARLTGPIVERFGEDPDPEQVRAAAQAGDEVAMTALGMLLFESGDTQEAVRWLTPGAEAGDVLAMFGLGGALIALGEEEAAKHWLERAASRGEMVLMDVLGDFAARTGDQEQARYWRNRVLQAGSAGEDADPDSDAGAGS